MQSLNEVNADIDNALKSTPPRNITPTGLRVLLKKVTQYVTDLTLNKLSAWFVVGNGQPSLNGTDTAYRTGRTIIGRSTDDGSEAKLQVEGYIFSKDGYFATNGDGYTPPTGAFLGPVVMTLLANWGVTGYSDLAFINTNPLSAGTGFWQLTTNNPKKLLLFLRNGRVGIGTTDPAETLHVAGRCLTEGLVTTGALPTIGGGAANVTPSIKAGSTDMCGGIGVITSGNTAANATLLTVTFTKVYAKAPRIILTANSASATGALATVYPSAITTAGFSLSCGNALGGPNSYEFNYLVIG